MSDNQKLQAMRTFAKALIDEPWDWINRVTTEAERDFTRHANPRRVLAMLDVIDAARAALHTKDCGGDGAHAKAMIALGVVLGRLDGTR